jgi:hypothetical protein
LAKSGVLAWGWSAAFYCFKSILTLLFVQGGKIHLREPL